MKYNGDFDRQIVIQQHQGGYVVQNHELAGLKTKVFESFEDAINYTAQGFGVLDIGERIVLSATRERKELPRTSMDLE